MARLSITTGNRIYAKVEGLEELQKRAEALPPKLKAEIARVLQVSADELVRNMQAIAPRGETGELAADIHTEAGPLPTSVKVVADAKDEKGHPYPAHVEFGHVAQGGVHVRKEPFFWPSVRVARKRVSGRVARAANKVIKAGV